MYSVYDSQRKLVKSGFTNYKSASVFKNAYGNSQWIIRSW